MRRIQSIFILGILACLLIFKSYFEQVGLVTGGSRERNRLRTLISGSEEKVHPIPIVILTYMRSGSSFVGDVLQQSKDVFYLFEPLRIPQFTMRNNKSFHSLAGDSRLYSSFLDAGQDILRNWTYCKLLDLPDVVWNDGFIPMGKKSKLFKACKAFESEQKTSSETVVFCAKMLKQVCLQSKYIVFKIIRLPVDDLEPLLTEFPEMKIIHLVRDPRPTILSQMRFFVVKKTTLRKDVTDFCSRVYRDLVTIDIFKKTYPGRMSTFFYEDLARNPLAMSKALYKFAGLKYSPEVENFVYNITMSGQSKNCGNLCTYKSNSSAQADSWRLKIPMSIARLVDLTCRPVYKHLGFREITSEEMLQDYDIPLRLEQSRFDDYRFA